MTKDKIMLKVHLGTQKLEKKIESCFEKITILLIFL